MTHADWWIFSTCPLTFAALPSRSDEGMVIWRNSHRQHLIRQCLRWICRVLVSFDVVVETLLTKPNSFWCYLTVFIVVFSFQSVLHQHLLPYSKWYVRQNIKSLYKILILIRRFRVQYSLYWFYNTFKARKIISDSNTFERCHVFTKGPISWAMYKLF